MNKPVTHHCITSRSNRIHFMTKYLLSTSKTQNGTVNISCVWWFPSHISILSTKVPLIVFYTSLFRGFDKLNYFSADLLSRLNSDSTVNTVCGRAEIWKSVPVNSVKTVVPELFTHAASLSAPDESRFHGFPASPERGLFQADGPKSEDRYLFYVTSRGWSQVCLLPDRSRKTHKHKNT